MKGKEFQIARAATLSALDSMVVFMYMRFSKELLSYSERNAREGT